jgi:hypothetical protein
VGFYYITNKMVNHNRHDLNLRADIFSEVGNFIDNLNPFSQKADTGNNNAGGSNNGNTNNNGNGNGNSNGNGNGNSNGNRNTATNAGSGSRTTNANPQQDATTIVRTVYKTVDPTFEGPVAGLTTVAPAQVTPVAEKVTVGKQFSGLPAGIESVPTGSLASTLAVATDLPANVSSTRSITSTNAQQTGASSSGGGSDGGAAAKAGIAIGVLAGVLVVFLIIFFAFNRRKKNAERQRLDDDEKINGPFMDPAPTPRTHATAPRISLRPVTQFLPNLNLDRRSSKLGPIGPGSAAPVTSMNLAASRAPGSSAWERPLTSQSNNPTNPFGSQAERLYNHSPIIEERTPMTTPAASTRAVSPPISPVSPVRAVSPVSPLEPSFPLHQNSIPAAAVGAVAGAAGIGALTRKASMRKDLPKPLDLTIPPPLSVVPPSPAGTDFSVSSMQAGQSFGPSTSAAAIAAAGGPQTSTVHRVQLDFKPTLEDEMELVAGQLVRLLHEYDDGWVSNHI